MSGNLQPGCVMAETILRCEMIPLDQLKSVLESAVPGAQAEMLRNDAPSAQHSLRIDNEHAQIRLHLEGVERLAKRAATLPRLINDYGKRDPQLLDALFGQLRRPARRDAD